MVRLLFHNDETVYNIPLVQLQKLSFFRKIPGITDESEINMGKCHQGFTYSNILKCIVIASDGSDNEDLVTELLDFLGEDTMYCSIVNLKKAFDIDIETLIRNKEYNSIVSRCRIDKFYILGNPSRIISLPLEVLDKIVQKSNVNKLLWTALMCGPDNIKLWDFLVKKGADVNSICNTESELIHCCVKKSIEKVKWLLDNGANPDIQDSRGSTVLFECGYKLGLAKVLIENGANVNIKDKQGKTALMYAVRSDNVSFVKFLLENGANPCIYDNHYQTAYGHIDALTAETPDTKYISDLLRSYGGGY